MNIFTNRKHNIFLNQKIYLFFINTFPLQFLIAAITPKEIHLKMTIESPQG